MALRSRSIIQTGGVSLSLFFFHPTCLLSLFSLLGLLFAPFHYRTFRVILRCPGSADLSQSVSSDSVQSVCFCFDAFAFQSLGAADELNKPFLYQ